VEVWREREEERASMGDQNLCDVTTSLSDVHFYYASLLNSLVSLASRADGEEE